MSSSSHFVAHPTGCLLRVNRPAVERPGDTHVESAAPSSAQDARRAPASDPSFLCIAGPFVINLWTSDYMCMMSAGGSESIRVHSMGGRPLPNTARVCVLFPRTVLSSSTPRSMFPVLQLFSGSPDTVRSLLRSTLETRVDVVPTETIMERYQSPRQ